MRLGHYLSSLARNDLRLIRRDAFLAGMIAIPIVIALFLRVSVPPLGRWLASRYTFDLHTFDALIVSYMIVLITPMMAGVLTGFMLLEERDERTLTALLVTPLPLSGFLAYRTLFPALLSVVLTPLAYRLSELARLPWAELLAVSLVAAFTAPATALFFATFAENKIQGFGLQKILNVLLIAPVAAHLIPQPWQYLTGIVFPPYWPLRALWSFHEGTPGAWVFLLLGTISQLALCLILIRHFRNVAYRTAL